MRCRLILALLAALCSTTTAQPATTQLVARPRAAYVGDVLPGGDALSVDAVVDSVRVAGFDVRAITVDDLASPDANLADVDLLVVPNARSLPIATIAAVERHLDAGGDLLACGLPMWDAQVVKVGGEWLTREQRDSRVRQVRPEHLVDDFDDLSPDDLALRWRRSSNAPHVEPAIELVPSDTRGRALRVATELDYWDTLSLELPAPMPGPRLLTCFRARGGPKTTSLAVEWRERDGSRWIAAVNLTPEWQWYVLPPEAFQPWQPPKGRGGHGDAVRLDQVDQFAVGLALSHTNVGRGPHEYGFDDLGVAPFPFPEVPPVAEPPHVEALSPGYQFYPVTEAREIVAPSSTFVHGVGDLLQPQPLIAMHPRPAGTGFDKGRPYRWISLLEAKGAGDDHRGTIAALVVPLKGPRVGAAWAAFAPTDPAFYRQPGVRRAVMQAATALRRGLFLEEGGAEYYTRFPDQPVRFGGRVIRTSRATEPLDPRVTLSITAAGRTLGQSDAWTQGSEQSVQLDPDGRFTLSDTIAVDPARGGAFLALATLADGSNIIDQVGHAVEPWLPSRAPSFIESRDGQFWLDGKPWKAHGVNYMPSSGIGRSLKEGELFEHWVGAAAYDPEVIERDLRRLKAMNFNAVSVFVYHEHHRSQNVLDFLRRCRDHGLRVNLSLRPGTPMAFEWEKVREMIAHLRLRENDTVFAYDLAWEPTHFDRAHQRKHYGKLWREWVTKRHRTIDAARQRWGVEPPLTEKGRLDVPPGEWLTTDGAWRRLVADYRRFLDELLAERYGEARRLVKSIDPNHAVSFRMTIAGDPTANDPNFVAYDFWGLRDAVDVWEPEAYGRIGDWDRVRPGMFTVAYAHLCDPAKPLVWAEIGLSVWDAHAMAPSAQRLDFQAQYARDFYRMMNASPGGVDGVFFWWYPGGYRTNERSDFGLINPDGTDRPVTKVIREEAATFLATPEPPGPDVWIGVDRDRDARGLHGIYEAAKDDFWRAVDAGQRPGLKWEKPPGQD